MNEEDLPIYEKIALIKNEKLSATDSSDSSPHSFSRPILVN
jgi:hypothetical protein